MTAHKLYASPVRLLDSDSYLLCRLLGRHAGRELDQRLVLGLLMLLEVRLGDWVAITAHALLTLSL